MATRLTKDSDALLCLLYKQYCQKRKSDVSKSSAKMFGSSADIQKTITPKWTFENVNETCNELSRAGFLDCSHSDDVVDSTCLSDIGIIYMENRFKDGLKSVLQYLERIKGLLPI